jgi:AcrR family transcriptional regulator
MKGLRERKKAATRQAISDIATRLFQERGFEQVTVAEIAEAAGVSVKTVFNYFGSKEDLFFDRADELLGAMLTALRERPPGVSPTAALRPGLLAGPIPYTDLPWSGLQRPEVYERIRRFVECERSSPALTARRLVIAQSWAERLGAEAGSDAWAAMFVGVLNLRARVYGDAILERRAARTIERRVRAAIEPALDALERGFAAVAETGRAARRIA